MSVKTNLTIKLDQDVRNEFNILCDEIGISMSGAIVALIKQSVRNKGMSFSIVDENGFTREESAELLRRISNLKESNLLSRSLIEE